MRLLVLAPSYPFPPQDGVKLRLTNLLRRLPEGWTVDLLGFDAVEMPREEPLPPPIRGTGLRIPFPTRPPGWRAHRLAQALRPEPSLIWKFRSPALEGEVRGRAREADAVLAVGLQMTPYLELVPPGVPTALDNYNVESRILERLAGTRSGLKRWYWLWEARKLARSERRLLEKAGTVFAISETDREGMASLSPRARLATIPMAIDLGYFQWHDLLPEPAPPRFTFVGAFNWHVNEDAAHWLCTEVWPQVRAALPGAELHLVGRDPSETVRALGRDSSVRITGTVPDIRPYMRDSTALLVPLRYGSGVRTKILEAFAVGRPVISTSVGCEGLPVVHGEHLLIADGSREFAGACIHLARDPEHRARLCAAGRRFVDEMDADVTRAFHEAFARAFEAPPREPRPLR
jgi:polysaccharide biosynthesis protein PslH